MANIDATLSGNSLAMAEKLPVKNIELPQASNILKVNASPRNTFPFCNKPRQPYPIKMRPTAPIPKFKVLYKCLKDFKTIKYYM